MTSGLLPTAVCPTAREPSVSETLVSPPLQRDDFSKALPRTELKTPVCPISAATTMGSVKSAGVSLLLLSLLLLSKPPSLMGCPSCMLVKSPFLTELPIYQCAGCCFSRAYPTPPSVIKNMAVQKNITSEATCCVASHTSEVNTFGLTLKNHTGCHCSTCYFQKKVY